MPQTKTFSTDAYRRVPYKDSIYRAFDLQPAERSNPPSQDPADFGPNRQRMARPKRIPEMKNPENEEYDTEREGGMGGTGPWKRPIKQWDT